MSCPACDKGQKRKCICGRRRTYNRRALDGVEELLDGDTAAAAPPRAPPPPDPEVAPPGETAAAAGDEPEPDPRMMGLRAPPSEAQAARAKKLRTRATVIAAKGRKNKQGVIPAAVMGMLYDFVEECERARDVGLLPRTALPAHSREGKLRALARKARDKFKLPLGIFRRKCAGSDLRAISRKGKRTPLACYRAQRERKFGARRPKWCKHPLVCLIYASPRVVRDGVARGAGCQGAFQSHWRMAREAREKI